MKDEKIQTVSIIVTAHERREFLIEAVESALKQTAGQYISVEIMIVKDFEDAEIDRFLLDHNVRALISKGELGEMLALGVENTSGEIICFLDDDDLFFPEKVGTVVSAFSRFPAAKLISHNYKSMIENRNNSSYSVNSDLSRVIDTSVIDTRSVIKLLNERVDFNLSCFSLKREIITGYVGELSRLRGGPDTFLFLMALEKKATIVRLESQLTYYRMRSAIGGIPVFKQEDIVRMKERSAFMVDMLQPFTISPNDTCRNVAKYLYDDWRVTQDLVGTSTSRRLFLTRLITRTGSLRTAFSKYYVVKSVLMLLYLFSPRAGFVFYKILKNRQNKGLLN